MMRTIQGLAAAGLLLSIPASAQLPPRPRPRLVVVIAVDQLRADYLDRFRPWFGPGGFARFFRYGASFPRTRYEQGTTATCPGHAVMMTGSYATVNGIVANEWYDPARGRPVYCAEDTTVTLVGRPGPGRSPRYLIGTTIGDLLKAASSGRSRVVTVAGKDRSAIMLGGHRADAAYWIVGTTFVTSSYYRPNLPPWAAGFNASDAITRWIGTRWERLLPAVRYGVMGRDDVPVEADAAGMGRTFPHPIANGDAFDHSPFLDEAVAEFAMRAVAAEEMGRDTVPDLLGLGFSANDRAGHLYGPDSHEVMDLMLRLDRILARLFADLDRSVGLANVLVVLTGDHGVAPMPEAKTSAGAGRGAHRLDPAVVDSAASRALTARFGSPPPPGWIAYDGQPLLYLNRAALSARHASLEEAERVAQAGIRRVPGVHDALTATELSGLRAAGRGGDVAHSFYPERGGDLYWYLEPYWLPTRDPFGSDHGSPWLYDRSVPLLWLGAGIRPGVYRRPATVADLAPTLSALLGLPPPAGAQGRALREALR